MSCEEYRPKLIEAAAMSADIGAALQTHLADCASCLQLFADEQKLYAAIEGALSRVANAEATPSFLPGVRAAIEQERSASVASRSRFLLWPAAAAMAAVALFFVVFQRIPSHPQTAPQLAAAASVTTSATGSSASSSTNSEADSKTGEIASKSKVVPREIASHDVRKPNFSSTLAKTESRIKGSQMPEVLVPPDERIALARFIAALPRRHEIAIALTKPALAAPSADVSSAPLEIAELKLEPLSPPPSEAK
jgi:negative regulator of sigma E activity